MPQQVGSQALDKRNRQLGGKQLELLKNNQRDGDHQAHHTLPEELGAGRKAEAAALDHLDVVIGKADGTEGRGGEDREPDKGVGRVRPEDGGQQNGDADKHSAHGGRAGFFQVRLGPIFTDKLADLELAQLLNDPGADEQSDEQRRERGKCRAESEIAEDPEGVKERKELFVEQPVEQGASQAGMGGV